MNRVTVLLFTAVMFGGIAQAQDVALNCEFIPESQYSNRHKDERIVVNEQARTASLLDEDGGPNKISAVFTPSKVTWGRHIEISDSRGNYYDETYDLSRETAKLVWEQTWRNRHVEHRVYQCIVAKATKF